MSVTAGRRLGARAACARAPAPAVADDVNQAQARSASGVPAASRQHRHADPLLPASPAREPLTGLLCTTMWITCVKRRRACAHIGEMLGIRGPGRAHDRAFTWESAIRALCMEKKTELSTRRAAIAHR
jgi:hypothetical protein